MNNKKFMYFEITDGGIENYKTTIDTFKCYGWMNDSCREEDESLIEWMRIAKIGEYYEHRTGLMVRIKK